MMTVMTAMIPVARAAATSAKAVKAMAAPAHATAVMSDKLSGRFSCQLSGCETTWDRSRREAKIGLQRGHRKAHDRRAALPVLPKGSLSAPTGPATRGPLLKLGHGRSLI